MKDRFIFAYRSILSGGCEHLILKHAVQLRENYNFEIGCVCEEISQEYQQLLSPVLDFVDFVQWNKIAEYCMELKERKINIITFEWDTFIRFFFAENPNKKTILFSVHPNCLIGFGEENDLRNNKILSVEFINSLVRNNHILVMDEIIKDIAEKYYETLFDFDILRICIDINDEWQNVERCIDDKYTSKAITTAARAEFPFKGYLLGLIKWFSKKENPDFLLNVISYGNEIETIRNEINNLPIEIKKCVNLIEKISYMDFLKILKETFLYIGMGTSILDAVAMGALAIPIKENTYEVLCNSRFDENHSNLCATDMYEYVDFDSEVNKAFELRKEQYKEITKKNFDFICENYDSKIVTQQLVKYFADCCEKDEHNEESILIWKSKEKEYYDFLNNWATNLKSKIGNRKVFVYGAGKGGRDIFQILTENNVMVDGFLDVNYANIDNIYNVRVGSPKEIDRRIMFVVVSLKKKNSKIIDYLKKSGFVYKRDFVYPFCEEQKKKYV